MIQSSKERKKHRGTLARGRSCLYCRQQSCPGTHNCAGRLHPKQPLRRGQSQKVGEAAQQRQWGGWLERTRRVIEESMQPQASTLDRKLKLLRMRRIKPGNGSFICTGNRTGESQPHATDGGERAAGHRAESTGTLTTGQGASTMTGMASSLAPSLTPTQESALLSKIESLENIVKELALQNTTQYQAISELKSSLEHCNSPPKQVTSLSQPGAEPSGGITSLLPTRECGVHAPLAMDDISRSGTFSTSYSGKREIISQAAKGIVSVQPYESLGHDAPPSLDFSDAANKVGKGGYPAQESSLQKIFDSTSDNLADETLQLRKQLRAAERKVLAWERWYVRQKQQADEKMKPLTPSRRPTKEEPPTFGPDAHRGEGRTVSEAERGPKQQEQPRVLFRAMPVGGLTSRLKRGNETRDGAMNLNAGAGNTLALDAYTLLAREAAWREVAADERASFLETFANAGHDAV
ncbi:uncharacterized protein TEOVI_000901900 [Trypanosoma equiperdum]|uniref:Uncharacterized protein n=2 Tax=Trypanozoon TaxID=39700 RepID=Q387T7_TRYB2|nr:hypothetical protein, conserved [Trypanosoma brucei brucei TREU927]EAN78935.1 hypothetical protein, conserved [Trypanosoma brucei brucei TREU927]SCU66721.1 hypothetical protein, conserved [Trypanosoma equiperdum]